MISLTAPKVSAQNTLVELENTKSENGTFSIDATYTSFVSTNAYLTDRAEHKSSQDHLLTGRLHLPGSYLISTTLWMNQDFNNERKLQTRDSLVTLTKSMGKVSENISWISRAAITLPLSEKSDETDGMITALRFNPIITYNAKDILNGLTVVFRPSFINNFYQYETSLNGNSNHNYTVNQRLTFLYSINKSLFLSLDNTYIRSWTYQGNTNDFFSLDQSISTLFTENFSGFIGHSIGGNALNVNGQESDISIYDTRRSTYYLGISYQF